jgi:gluconate 5-dehydrogenase
MEQTALVLGASGALGAAIAGGLAKAGFRLGLHAFRHVERLPALADARTYLADLSQPEAIQNLAGSFVKDFGRLDVLVWSAGIAREAPVLSLSEEDLREVLNLNLTAPFLVAKAFSRQFLKQKAGSFILLSSHAGLSGRAGGAAYAMAQSGLLALMRSLAREWGPLGVRVNAVVPPFVAESDLGRASSAAFADAVRARSVYAGNADPKESVAQSVIELVGNRTASGQVVVVDARIAH